MLFRLLIVFSGLIVLLAQASRSSSNVLMEEESEEAESNVLPTVSKIEECVTMAMEEGVYELKSQGLERTCGLYLSSDPAKIIKLTFHRTEVDCDDGGLVAVVDGWELNGHLLPSAQDHQKSISARIHEFCGTQRTLPYYLSSQNMVMVQYRIPQPGQGFIVSVEFVDNLTPCNVLLPLLPGEEVTFTSLNYGRRMNCSVTTLLPAHVDILALHVGRPSTPLQTKCPEKGAEDYVEVVGSSSLDNSEQSFISVCGSHNSGDEENLFVNVQCHTTNIRMVSSGKHNNRLQLNVRWLEDTDNVHFMC